MVSRRKFLQAATVVGAITTFSGIVPGISAFAAAPLRTRRSVNNMALDDPDLSTYRDFVGLMRNNPQTQNVSWLGFANQHGNEQSFKYCPHGDWYFLPWHRGYVDMYEKAAMTLIKNDKFAMPYWDWTTLRNYPAAFTDPTYKGKPNPLYVPNRNDPPTQRNALTGGNALTDALVGPDVMRRIYKETVFEAFGTSRNPQQRDLDPRWVPAGGGRQGILESTPHNNVHNNIGAFMPQSNSPRDPIFMMHHSNIDRIWAYWSALGRQNSTDPLWLNMPFANNYIRADGSLYSWLVKDLQSTAALGYTYDGLPQADKALTATQRDQNLAALFDPTKKGAAKRILKTNTTAAKVEAHLGVPFALEPATLKAMTLESPAQKPTKEIVALISDIAIGDNIRAIRVFINREALSQDVPDSDPHYVTTLSFLRHKAGKGHEQHKSLPSAVVDLTETLIKLAAGKKLTGDNITVQLLPVAAPGVDAKSVGQVVPASVEIAVL